MYYSLLSPKMIPFVLFPQASEPSMNFNISKMVCRKRLKMSNCRLWSIYWNSNKFNKAKTENERLVFSVLLYVILSTSTRTGQIIQNFLILLSNFWTAAIFIRGSQWGGGFYGYWLEFWLFYGYRLIFFSYG